MRGPAPTLIHLPYSPWSERARWALDARGITYARRHYQPVLGEPELRWRLRRWTGPVSVPVLLTETGPIADSWEIARWADARGAGPQLVPAALGDLEHWIERSQRGMAAGRMLSLRRVLEVPAALDELTPPFARSLGTVGRSMIRAGVRRTLRKYAPPRDEGDHQRTLCDVLDELRAAVRGPTLLAAFSYADITMAQVLVFVRPPDPRFLRAGPVNRELLGDPDLANRYADLVTWRDQLYATYRAPAAT